MSRFFKLLKTRKSNKGNLPNLIVIGAQKCATTSLHYYLSLHPQISMSKVKELNFFVQEYNWNKEIEWYKSNFTSDADVYGESSPMYTHYPFFRGVPERMYSVVPEAKLIYILRDPIDRIISHYIHQYSAGLEHRELSDALNNFENNPYITRSRYYMQIEQYLNHFPKSSILIITLEDLHKNTQQTLQQVFRFLKVDDSFYSRKFSSMRHKSSDKRGKNGFGLFLTKKFGTKIFEQLPSDWLWHAERLLYLPFSHRIERPVLNGTLWNELIKYLRADINRLRTYTGYDFVDWCV